jgi:predicted NBD/HSP70 family sugar kinase
MANKKKFVSPGNIEGKVQRKENSFLALVRRHPGISRQNCAQKMGVSTFNVSRMTPTLIEKGMITEGESDPANSCGRPSTPLFLNPEYQYFAGIDIEAEQWRFAIIDFSGNLIHSWSRTFSKCQSRNEYIEQLSTLIKQAITESGEKWEKVAAIGIGAPGFLDHETGIVENYEILSEFKRIPLLDICSLASSKPSFITHNISCLATHSLWKKDGAENEVIIHAAIRAGISVAFNIKDNIYYGRKRHAGELGLFLINGKTVQETAGITALKQTLPDLDERFWHGVPEAINEAFRRRTVKKVISQAMDNISVCLANAAALLDNDEIIVYSTLFSQENPIWELLRDSFEKHRKAQGLEPLKISCGIDSEFNAAVGAALYALERQYPRKLSGQKF